MNSNASRLVHELNERAWLVAEQASALAIEMDIRIFEDESGAVVFDFGVDRLGTLAGGLALSMVCLADLADVQILAQPTTDLALPLIQVATDHPLEACVASQYAGWPLSYADYFAMCSGPARVARGQEELLTEYDLEHSMDRVVGVLESKSLPDSATIEHFANECCVEPSQVMLCIARTSSIPGSLQVVARSVETTMHKLHELKFDLNLVKRAIGTAPLPPTAKDDLTALGWTNDSILYGANINLWIDADDDVIEAIGPDIPSSSSNDFGTPFQEIFERYDKDFYKIDKMLFSPAQVVINNTRTGRVFQYGEIRTDILKKSFGIGQ